MSISKVYNNNITVYCADRFSIFRPYPAKDNLLETAQAGEFTLNAGKTGKTTFQIILASNKDIIVTDVRGKNLTCFSVEGIDNSGKPFRKTTEIQGGKPWPLWCLLDAPNDDKLDITVTLASGENIGFSMNLNVSDEFSSSLDDASSLARLEWLNSTEGAEDSLPKGFTPVTLCGKTVKILGRDITISEKGFIQSIGTYFKGNNGSFSDTPRELLAEPIRYIVSENGKELEFTPCGMTIKCENETKCTWTSENRCGDLVLTISGEAEFDGTIHMNAEIKNAKDRKLSVRLLHKPNPDFAKYFIGLGKQGGKTPDSYNWKWDENKRQDSYWCGSVNGGVFIHPTAAGLDRPFVNIYFHHSHNYMPLPWVNDGKGYFKLENSGEEIFFDSGDFIAENTSTFCADIMVSPFKKVDMKEHWNTHFYHKNFNVEYNQRDIDDAKNVGCTHINLHHGNDTLPYLNYPMHDMEAMKELAELAHKNGLGLKPYYTVRELTTRLPELFALRSLRDEIFPKPTYNQGGVPFHNGVDPFVKENFGDEVIPAWKHTFMGGKYDGTTDPTLVTNPHGRICNFYLGSLAWIIQKIGIDGLYIDDVAYDRTVMRRVRRVFDKYNPGAKIDFHTCNHFEDSPALGFGMSHNMLIYMELFPYLDSLWIGEGFQYDETSAEYMLTEVSGLPFGVMSEMLEGDCNVWRGMLFGITSRYPFHLNYTGPSAVPVWNMRKPFENAEMIGFWEDEQPIFADNKDVKCTVYRDGDRYLCCFANYSDGEASFKLCGDALCGKKLYAPLMDDIQEERTLSADETITLSKLGGIMIIVE